MWPSVLTLVMTFTLNFFKVKYSVCYTCISGKIVWLPWNKKQTYQLNVRNQIWPSMFWFGSWPWIFKAKFLTCCIWGDMVRLLQNVKQIQQFGGQTHSLWASPGLINFWSDTTEFQRFLIIQTLSMHLQTNRWLDKAKISRTNLLWAFPSLIDFWSCSTEFWLFPGLWLITNGWTDRWISFLAFGDKPLIWLRSNLVGK